MDPHPRQTPPPHAHPAGHPHPTLGLALEEVFRPEIALPLKFGLNVCTVGGLLGAWTDADRREQIEQVFADPQQAEHAVAVCAAWLGRGPTPALPPDQAWWAE